MQAAYPLRQRLLQRRVQIYLIIVNSQVVFKGNLCGFFAGVVWRFKKLHKGQGEYQGRGESHNSHSEENNALEVPELIKPPGGQLLQEFGVDLGRIEGEEYSKDQSGQKAGYDARRKTRPVVEFVLELQTMIFNGFINPESGDHCIEQAEIYIGVQSEKWKDQKISDQTATRCDSKSYRKWKLPHV